MKMSNKVYDVLKWIALILLPAIATLYFALAGIWGFPYGEQIVGTIAAIDAFLGAILQISTHNYIKEMKALNNYIKEVEAPNDGDEVHQLELGE